jgi:hypothetical protein
LAAHPVACLELMEHETAYPPVDVDQSGGAIAAQHGRQTPDLALAEAQELGCVARRDHATGELHKHLYAALL